MAWLSSSPYDEKRCCSIALHVRPHSESSHSAASAIRRSPGRQHVELLAQPAGGAAVVGDRHDRREAVGHEAQRGQAGGQAVAAAERDDRRVLAPLRCGGVR